MEAHLKKSFWYMALWVIVQTSHHKMEIDHATLILNTSDKSELGQ